MFITLYGNPKSTNNIYRFKGRMMYMNSEGRGIKESYKCQAIQQGLKEQEGDIQMTMTLYFGDKRTRDIDNYNKLILDALSGIAYKDDKQIQKLTLMKSYDKETPRVEIEINNF